MELTIYKCDICGKKVEDRVETLSVDLSEGLKSLHSVGIHNHLCQKCYLPVRKQIDNLVSFCRPIF